MRRKRFSVFIRRHDLGSARGDSIAPGPWRTSSATISSDQAHTTSGLMRAPRASEDFFALDGEGFELTAPERAAAVVNLWLDECREHAI